MTRRSRASRTLVNSGSVEGRGSRSACACVSSASNAERGTNTPAQLPERAPRPVPRRTLRRAARSRNADRLRFPAPQARLPPEEARPFSRPPSPRHRASRRRGRCSRYRSRPERRRGSALRAARCSPGIEALNADSLTRAKDRTAGDAPRARTRRISNGCPKPGQPSEMVVATGLAGRFEDSRLRCGRPKPR